MREAWIEFCAFLERITREFGFECGEPVYLIGKQNEKLKFASDVWNAHRSESIAFRIAEIMVRSLHRWHVHRRAAVDVEWLPLSRAFGEFFGPWRFEINRIR